MGVFFRYTKTIDYVDLCLELRYSIVSWIFTGRNYYEYMEGFVPLPYPGAGIGLL